jgi:hypothetical protein
MSYRSVDSFRAGSGWNCSSILILLVGFIIRKFVTMHGHMNVKEEEEEGRRKVNSIEVAATVRLQNK